MTIDPAYDFEFERLERLCRNFLAIREEARAHPDRHEVAFAASLLVTGMLISQLAAIYKLSPPAGILDPATLFAREA